ncbi:GNAT family N-acetyltransferase [Paenibacillus sp. CMAA1364]
MNPTLYDQKHGIYMRSLHIGDSTCLLELRLRTRYTHAAFEPKQHDDFYTLYEQQQIILRRIQDAENDQAYAFGIFTMQENLIGLITLSNVARGVAQFADVGYFIKQQEHNKGYMTAALKLILQYAFKSLELHRLQAAILPHNISSRRVLEKSGFRYEGKARQYIKINDQWQDHLIFAMLADD